MQQSILSWFPRDGKRRRKVEDYDGYSIFQEVLESGGWWQDLKPIQESMFFPYPPKLMGKRRDKLDPRFTGTAKITRMSVQNGLTKMETLTAYRDHLEYSARTIDPQHTDVSEETHEVIKFPEASEFRLHGAIDLPESWYDHLCGKTPINLTTFSPAGSATPDESSPTTLSGQPIGGSAPSRYTVDDIPSLPPSLRHLPRHAPQAATSRESALTSLSSQRIAGPSSLLRREIETLSRQTADLSSRLSDRITHDPVTWKEHTLRAGLYSLGAVGSFATLDYSATHHLPSIVRTLSMGALSFSVYMSTLELGRAVDSARQGRLRLAGSESDMV